MTPSEQPHATLSVALTCPKRDDGEKKVNHLIAFESHSIRQAGDKYLNLYGQGDLPFKHVSLFITLRLGYWACCKSWNDSVARVVVRL